MKALHAEFADRVQFLTVFIREAHPGATYRAHTTFEQKVEYARVFKREEAIPWPVLIDDVAGTIHCAYGGLPANVFVIDADGRVAFEQKWLHVPTLYRALSELLAASEDRGRVSPAVDRKPHLLAAMVRGWHALSRGGPHAVRDVVVAAPPVVLGLGVGRLVGPLIAPVALRHHPLPASVRVLLGGLVAVGTLAILRLRRRPAR